MVLLVVSTAANVSPVTSVRMAWSESGSVPFLGSPLSILVNKSRRPESRPYCFSYDVTALSEYCNSQQRQPMFGPVHCRGIWPIPQDASCRAAELDAKT